MRFGFDGEQQTLEAIARALGVSRERVRTLEQQAFARLSPELSGVVDAEKDELAGALGTLWRARQASPLRIS